MPRHTIAAALALMVLLTVNGNAQWLNHPSPGIPRTSDGKPDLNAAVPRTADRKPDLSGIWAAVANEAPDALGVQTFRSSQAANIARNVPGGAPLTAWAKALLDQRRKENGRNLPTMQCLPSGLPGDMLRRLPFKIVQNPTLTIILIEEFNNWRQIHSDGRSLPEDPQPTWFGYSVGKWDGDVYVVTTAGFNDRTWLDSGGTPHSEQLRLTERFQRRDFGHMDIEYTFDDPKAFTKTWSTTVKFQLMPDTEILEHQCENERDADRIRAISDAPKEKQ